MQERRDSGKRSATRTRQIGDNVIAPRGADAAPARVDSLAFVRRSPAPQVDSRVEVDPAGEIRNRRLNFSRVVLLSVVEDTSFRRKASWVTALGHPITTPSF